MKEMTDWEIDAKHRRIRGSNRLKYPGNEDRCLKDCGLHYAQSHRGEQVAEHRCFLAVDHELECQFSSECKTSLVEVAGDVAA